MKKSGIRMMAGLCVIALAVLAYGCPKPTAEMQWAEGAIKEAKAAGAAQYAPTELSSAENSLSEGQDMMDKWRYKNARAKFEESYQLALNAKQKALAAQQETPDEPAPPPVVVRPPSEVTTHTVVKGECLWWIAEYGHIYNDPFQWPLIYWENKEQIDREARRHGNTTNLEDWIYPGQEFAVPRDSSLDEVKKARKRAGAPAPYTPPGY